jgi:hypothetical protein
MLQECGLRVTKLGRCPSMLMATSVVHPTSVHLAYAQVALPGIGKARENIIFGINEPFPLRLPPQTENGMFGQRSVFSRKSAQNSSYLPSARM